MDQRFILDDETAITLHDRSTGEAATTTKHGARAILAAWYGELAAGDPVVADAIGDVADAIENHSDLTGSDYLGLSVELAD